MMLPDYMESTKHQAQSWVILALAVSAIALACSERRKSPMPEPAAEIASSVVLDVGALADLARWCAQRWQGEVVPAPPSLKVPAHAAYVAARRQGEKLVSSWGEGENVGAALASAFATLGDGARSATALEIFIVARMEPIPADAIRDRLLSNIHRGVVGIETRRGSESPLRYSPTEVIASNRSHEKLLALSGSEQARPEQSFSLLHGQQYLVDLERGVATLMERGNAYVPLELVTQESVANFSDLMATWLWGGLHPNGRMSYLYWPSQGREAPGRDNLIRQFMATIALGRLAAKQDDAALWDRSAQNIDYNLRTYYRQEGDLGLVELRGKVKLGAVALAALAIVEHPNRARWKEQEEALRRTVDSLWQEDGSFKTFHKPADRNDNQNFYPGEALLLWATLYAESRDDALLGRIMKSFSYYRDWHLDPDVENRRNPAFIPWHTQSYYLVWQQTRSPALRDFIFEMNDWLLAMQQWDEVTYPDTRGRFYSPDHPYGPPHASATGVYLEGLIDAYSLAKAVGDDARTRRYAEAIRRGLRSSMQLQFVDDIDMFYISKKEKVLGGLRTTVYDNQIRCDNVQHTLMGTLKILESGLLPTS